MANNALTFYQDKPKYISNIADSYNFLGNCYWYLIGLDTAMHYYHTALDIFNKAPDNLYRNVFEIPMNLAYGYIEKTDSDKVEYYLKMADSLSLQTLGTKHIMRTEIYNVYGSHYNRIGKYYKAIQSLQKGNVSYLQLIC